jgi:hypothetical protein
MATYLKYSDVPVFANFLQENTNPIVAISSGMLAATDVSLNMTPSLSANRYLGKSQITSDFSTTGPLEGKLSITFFPLLEVSNSNLLLNVSKANQLAFFGLTGNFPLGHIIQVSNLFLKKCYLNNYSIKINPYQPISVTANFTVYDISQITSSQLIAYQSSISALAKDTTKPYYESLHALTTKLDSSISTNLPETKINIDINVDCNRTPIYPLGQAYPDTVVLNTVERSVNIQGENIGKIVDITGSNPGNINISFLPLSQRASTPSINNNVLNFNIQGIISSQEISISQNSILNGKVVIKEILL